LKRASVARAFSIREHSREDAVDGFLFPAKISRWGVYRINYGSLGFSLIMKKSFYLKLITSVAAALFSVLIAEVALRFLPIWIGRNSDTMFKLMEHSDTLGWKMKPAIHETVDFVDVQDIPIRSNSDGFWGDEFPERRSPDDCRIIFLGDSLTWGYGVREEERFSNVLGAENSALETLNFGMAGYGTDQALQVWRHFAQDYDPDIVVLTVHSNDYRENVSVVRWGLSKPYFELRRDGSMSVQNVPVDSSHDYWQSGIFHEIANPYSEYYSVPVERRSRILHWTLRNSSVARLVYTVAVRRPAVSKASGNSSGPPSVNRPREKAVTATPPLAGSPAQIEIEVLEALVKELASGVRASGARFLVVLSMPTSRRYIAHKATWDANGIPYLDATTDPLRRRIRDDSQPVYYPYNDHWTPAAHRATAGLLAERIGDKGLCQGI